MLKTREQASAENDASGLDGLMMTAGQPHYGAPGTCLARRDSGIIFITGSLIQPAKLQLAAELAKRDGCILIALMPGIGLSSLSEAENLRLMLRFCDTIVFVDPIQGSPDPGPRLLYSDVAFAISEGLKDTSCRKPLRRMLTRGQLARVSAANSSSNVEEALLKALRALLPVAEFSNRPQVFLSILGREIDRKTLVRASRWVARAMRPIDIIVCSAQRSSQATASVYLLVTGIAFPHSPSSRKLSIDVDELEPESDNDNGMDIRLGLDQME